jgi:glycosyltransferase involved in cell wall biosynthesis
MTNGVTVPASRQEIRDISALATDVSTPAEETGTATSPASPGTTTRTPLTVSLVIPTRNEAANIAWVLEQVPSCVTEIVVVDGHSSDATLVTARSARPDIRVVMQSGIGKGDALAAGFAASTGDIVLMIDADGSMSPLEIPHFLYFLTHGYDFVKGSRFVAGGGSLDITPLRRNGNRALMRLVSSLYEASLTDLCYGFIGFHRRYLEYVDLSTPGFEVETRMVISAIQAGLRMAEVPSLELPRRSGTSNLRTFRDGTRVLRTVLRTHESGLTGHAVQQVRRLVHRKAQNAVTAVGLDRPLEAAP